MALAFIYFAAPRARTGVGVEDDFKVMLPEIFKWQVSLRKFLTFEWLVKVENRDSYGVSSLHPAHTIISVYYCYYFNNHYYYYYYY